MIPALMTLFMTLFLREILQRKRKLEARLLNKKGFWRAHVCKHVIFINKKTLKPYHD